MYLKINNDFYRIIKSELRNQTFHVLLQHHQAKEKTADLDVTTLVEEQLNDPVLQKVRSWIKKSDKRPTKTHDNNQSKALLSYFNRFEQLFIDEETNLLCYNETVQETNKTEMK